MIAALGPSALYLVLAAAPGVGDPSVNAALAAADALEASGRFDAARRQLVDVAAAVAPCLAQDLRLRACALWQREGDESAARACYLDVAATAHDREGIARARYGAAAAVAAGAAVAQRPLRLPADAAERPAPPATTAKAVSAVPAGAAENGATHGSAAGPGGAGHGVRHGPAAPAGTDLAAACTAPALALVPALSVPAADDVALVEALALVAELPETDGARRALALARSRAAAAGGDAAEGTLLEALADRLAWAGEPGARNCGARVRLAEVLVLLANRRLVAPAQPAAALRLLDRAEPVAAGTVWADDVTIAQARALRAAGQIEPALARYRALIDAQESPWIIGRFYSSYYGAALLETGELLEDAGRLQEALAAYAAVATALPTSPLVDDAAYRRARLQATLAGEPGPLRAFARDFPDSRHVRAAGP